MTISAALARDPDKLIPVLSAHITKGVGLYGDELLTTSGAKRRGPKSRKSGSAKA